MSSEKDWERRVSCEGEYSGQRTDVKINPETKEPSQLWCLPRVKVQPTAFTPPVLLLGPLHFLSLAQAASFPYLNQVGV